MKNFDPKINITRPQLKITDAYKKTCTPIVAVFHRYLWKGILFYWFLLYISIFIVNPFKTSPAFREFLEKSPPLWEKYCGKIVSRIVIDVGLKSAMDFLEYLRRINFRENQIFVTNYFPGFVSNRENKSPRIFLENGRLRKLVPTKSCPIHNP